MKKNELFTFAAHKSITIKMVSKFYDIISVFEIDVSSCKGYRTKAVIK